MILGVRHIMKELKGGRPDAEGDGKASKDILGANSAIGRKLRQYYDGLVTEEVPDRFTELLSRLEKSEKENRDGERA